MPDWRLEARKAARRHGIDPRLFERQIDQESGFADDVISGRRNSSAGAQGIAQIVPRYHPGVNPLDPAAALDYAANWMSQLLGQYGGDWSRALAHYNGGGGAVQALASGRPYGETKQYLSSILGGLGPRTAEAAELDTPDGGSGVEDRPPSSFEPPSRLGGAPSPVLSPNRRTIKKQLDEARADLPKARERYAKAQADTLSIGDFNRLAPEAIAGWQQKHNQEVSDANKDLDTLVKRIDDLEAKDAKAEQDEQAAADKAEKDRQAALNKPLPKQPAPTSPGSPSEQFIRNADGTWEPNPNYRPPAPKPQRTRTYEAGGARITEQADEAGGFQPLPSGVFDPNTQLSAAQSASLPIQQQNANSSSVSAAASMLHAQVAQGTLDFNQAKTIFDYIVAQRAPVEEGGKLYDPGRQPGSASRAFFGLPTREYSAVDAAGFFGRPELNQHVRGPYPFGAGPISADEYHQRQAGTFQQNQMPAPQQPQMAQPMPSSSAGTMMAAQQPGGFQPGMPPQQPAPQQPQAPGFGSPPGYGQDALMADMAKIRATLIAQGISPEKAEQAARLHLGIPTPTGLGAAV